MKIDDCIQDALSKLSPQKFDNGHRNTLVSLSECQLFMWPQTWMDSSCGHDVMFSCPKVTSATCFVVMGPMDDACVYHNQKFAYKVENPSETFWDGINERSLPGARELQKKHLEKEVTV